MSFNTPIVLATFTDSARTVLFRRATGYYVDAAGEEYLPGLIFPEYQEELKDLFSGVENTRSIRLQIEIGGGAGDLSMVELAAETDFRTVWVSLYYYDPVDGENIEDNIDCHGRIDSYEYNDILFIATIKICDDEIFDKLLPPDVITTGLFTDTAIDIGRPVNMPIGHCRHIPIWNIKNDTESDEYDYLVGYDGVVEVTTVYREWTIVPETEYEVMNNTTYPGFCVLRFSFEQKDFSGNFHALYADVTGFSWESAGVTGGAYARHMLDALYLLLVNESAMNDEYGADLTGGDGFIETLWAFEGTTVYGDYKWWTDINIGGEQRRAGDWLNEILAYTPIQLRRNYTGAWAFDVDIAETPTFFFGQNDGHYNNCVVESNWVTSASSSLKKCIVQYNFSEDKDGSFYYEISATAHANYGAEKTIQLRAVNETMTAKKILSRIVNTDIYSNKWLKLTCGIEAKKIRRGNKIRLFSSYDPPVYQDYIVQESVKKYPEKFEITCRSYHADIYSDLTIADPEIPDRTIPVVKGPATLVGTFTNSDETEEAVELTMQELAPVSQIGMFNGVISEANYDIHSAIVGVAYRLPADLPGSILWAKGAAAATTIFTLKKGATTIGTATFAAAGTVATLAFTTATSFLSTDLFVVTGPATPDVTLSDLRWTLVGVRERV